MAASNGTGGETLADANRRKLEYLEETLTERLDELEAENRQLRREIAELKGGEEAF
jgi:cell division protein FtsB